MVMLFGKQISVSTTISDQHQEDDPSNNPPSMGSLGGDSKTRVFVPDHHQENPQDSDRAADNSDVNLAKFRGEVDFLGLMRAQDPTVVLNPEPLRWFHPSSNRILQHDSGSCSYSDVNLGESSILGLRAQEESDDPTVVLNPEPLRWFHSGDGSSNFVVSDGKKKRNSSSSSDDDEKKKNPRKKIKKNYPQEPTFDLSSEFRKGIIGQTIDGPVFVYRKKLEGSDVNKRLNRLLITEEEKLVNGFLSGDDCEMFRGGRGVNIDVFGVDGRGREYELRLSKWKTMIVINREWYKMVVANGAVAGAWVDLWGFRCEDAQIRFAVIFSSNVPTSDHHQEV